MSRRLMRGPRMDDSYLYNTAPLPNKSNRRIKKEQFKRGQYRMESVEKNQSGGVDARLDDLLTGWSSSPTLPPRTQPIRINHPRRWSPHRKIASAMKPSARELPPGISPMKSINGLEHTEIEEKLRMKTLSESDQSDHSAESGSQSDEVESDLDWVPEWIGMNKSTTKRNMKKSELCPQNTANNRTVFSGPMKLKGVKGLKKKKSVEIKEEWFKPLAKKPTKQVKPFKQHVVLKPRFLPVRPGKRKSSPIMRIFDLPGDDQKEDDKFKNQCPLGAMDTNPIYEAIVKENGRSREKRMKTLMFTNEWRELREIGESTPVSVWSADVSEDSRGWNEFIYGVYPTMMS